MEIRKKIKIYEISTACILFFIPLILRIIDGGWRISISNYAYSDRNEWFYFLITTSGSLFIFNYIMNNKHWYNLIAGISLFGIGLTPHMDYTITHYIFSIIFFSTSLLSIPLSSSKKNIEYKYLIILITIVVIALHFTTKVYSLLVAEWIAMLPICAHFIIKSIKWEGFKI